MAVPMSLIQSLNYKFWSKVAPGCGEPEESPYATARGPCWKWTGAVSSQGYGVLEISGQQKLAHRVSLQIHGVELGQETDHLCRNRLCVNPEHLEPVTRRENTARGRGKASSAIRNNTCKRGHPLSGDNLSIRGGKYRRCRTCARIWAEDYRNRKREKEKLHEHE